MPADTAPREELARFIDLHGHRVTAITAGLRGEQVAILTTTVTVSADEDTPDGHPFLDRECAGVLGEALVEFANRGPS